MSGFSSTSLAFRLEAVDWDRRPDGATLHLTGRWRRRRPIGAIQPVLVVERGGRRHRVPARPDPPGLTGIAPGAWRMSFELPPELVPGPEDRMWLQIGGVMAGLPVPGELADAAAPEPEPTTPEAPAAPVAFERAERMALQAELAVLRASLEAEEGERERELQARVAELEAEREALLTRLAEAEAEARRAAARADAPSDPTPAAAPADPRLGAVLDAIGEELGALRDALSRERSAREAAQARAASAEGELAASRQRAAEAFTAIEALRGELAGAAPEARGPSGVGASEAADPLAPPTVPDPSPASSGLDPSRFDAARSRLRTVPVDPAPVSGWLGRALRSLAAADPAAAGRLVLALLPAQAIYASGPVRYDLALSDAGILLVDVPGDRQPVAVRASEQARPADEIAFAFRGSLAALGRLVAEGRPSGPISRRRRGRIAGRREAAAVLSGLGSQQLSLPGLLAGGVSLDAGSVLELVAHAIDPAKTRAERFTLAFALADPGAGARWLLRVRDGERPAVVRAPISTPAAAEVRVSEAELPALLAGVPGVAASLEGDPAPLERIRAWLVSAQSG